MVDENSLQRNGAGRQDSDFPEALAELGVNYRPLCFTWTVPACPICGARHLHGGGSIRGGESPTSHLGHRAGHCRQVQRGYLLVDSRPAATARILRSVAAKFSLRFDRLNGGLVRGGVTRDLGASG